MTPSELAQHKTDGHMDIDAVRPGAILVCPVKVDGGGVYLGDMHAMQGDGEIAGHTSRRVRHRHARGRGRSRAWTSTARCCSRSPRTCRSSPAR